MRLLAEVPVWKRAFGRYILKIDDTDIGTNRERSKSSSWIAISDAGRLLGLECCFGATTAIAPCCDLIHSAQRRGGDGSQVTGGIGDQSPIVPVRVMIVEDFEPFRVLIASRLKPPGFQIVCETSDGLYAVQRAEELRPDLVIMDVGLERLNGIYATRRIRSAASNSRILFFTAYSDPEIVRDALEAGAAGFVAKLDADELLPAVQAVLLGKRYFSKSVKGDDLV